MLFDLLSGLGGIFAACETTFRGSLLNEKMGKKGIEGLLPP